MLSNLRARLMAHRKPLCAVLFLILTGLLCWGGRIVYDRFTASPAKWANAMAAGQAAWEKGDYDVAVKHYTAALCEAEKFGGSDTRLADSLCCLGLSTLKTADYYIRRPTFRSTFDQLCSSDGIRSFLHDNREYNRYAGVQILFKRALSIYKRHGDNTGIASCYISLAMYQLYCDNQARSRNQLRKAPPLFEKGFLPRNLMFIEALTQAGECSFDLDSKE